MSDHILGSFIWKAHEIEISSENKITQYNIMSVVKISELNTCHDLLVEIQDIWTDVPNNPPKYLYKGIMVGNMENLVGQDGYSGMGSITENEDGTYQFVYRESPHHSHSCDNHQKNNHSDDESCGCDDHNHSDDESCDDHSNDDNGTAYYVNGILLPWDGCFPKK